jgi:hypothetical protein
MADRKTSNDELFVPYGYESMKKMAKAAFDDARPFLKQAHQIKNLMNPQLARTLQQFAEPMMGFGKPLERKPIISKPARNELINEESIRRIIREETGNARRRDIARKAILDVTHSKPDQQAEPSQDNKPTLKIKECLRVREELTQLIYEICSHFGIKSKMLRDKTASVYWGKIINCEFHSDLVKSVNLRDREITLNDGKTVTKQKFLSAFNDRFE